jgi:hypothetical protein
MLLKTMFDDPGRSLACVLGWVCIERHRWRGSTLTVKGDVAAIAQPHRLLFWLCCPTSGS